jgi:hypothetical protein
MFANLQGLVAVVVAAGLSFLLHSFSPFLNSSKQILYLGGILFGVSLLFDIMKQTGRIFFLPLWLVAWFMMIVGAWQHWGWLASLGMAALLGMMIFGILGLFYIGERRMWKAAPIALQDAQTALEDGKKDKAWEHLQQAAFVPRILPMDSAMCEHNRHLLTLLPQLIDKTLPTNLKSSLAKLDDIFARKQAGETIPINAEVHQHLLIFSHLLLSKGDIKAFLDAQPEISEKQQATIQAALAQQKAPLPKPPEGKPN